MSRVAWVIMVIMHSGTHKCVSVEKYSSRSLIYRLGKSMGSSLCGFSKNALCANCGSD